MYAAMSSAHASSLHCRHVASLETSLFDRSSDCPAATWHHLVWPGKHAAAVCPACLLVIDSPKAKWV